VLEIAIAIWRPDVQAPLSSWDLNIGGSGWQCAVLARGEL